MANPLKLCIQESKCIKCRLCEKVCPTGAMKFEGDNAGNVRRVYDKSKCFRCGLCADVCPKGVFVFSDMEVGNTLSLGKVPNFRDKANKFSRIKTFQAIVQKVEKISPRVYQLVLRIDGDEGMTFLSGQYADVHYSENFLRPYSISSSPENKFSLEFTVENVPGGLGGQKLLSLKAGDKIRVSGPYGTLVLDETVVNEPYVFIATGTGIAPFTSMIEDLLKSGAKNDISLIFGLRKEEDIFYRSRLEELKSKYSNFHFEICLSQPSSEWAGFTGRVTDYLKSLENLSQDTRYYICGLSQMIDSTLAVLEEKGANIDNVFYEKFV